MSGSFFSLPEETKLSYGWTTPEANRGYSAPGREKVSVLTDKDEIEKIRKSTPDLKETFEIGREGEPDHPNQWPDETREGVKETVMGFKEVMLGFFDRCKALHVEVMRAIAVGMGLDGEFFDGFVDVGDNTLRLLHYPPVEASVFKTDAVRAGAHSDYGSITLYVYWKFRGEAMLTLVYRLFQDSRGGLQVKSPEGTFVDATPIEGTVVVNAGDLLARWSNDTIKSTIHRVVEPPTKSDKYPARYSIAYASKPPKILPECLESPTYSICYRYFCNPNFKSHIEAIPGTYTTEAEKKYDGINSGDYLVQRLAATY